MSGKSIKHKKQSGAIHCDICDNPEILEEHHIEGRKILKANHPSNLCYICPNCHTKIHYGKIIIEKWCNTTSGKKLFWHKKGERSITGYVSKSHIISQ